MAIRSKNRVSTNFNMSSMTDIVFLLLIFFIIASTLISPEGMEVIMPKASADPEPNPQTVTVSITEDLKYYVNKDQVEESEIETFVMTFVKDKDDPGIILKADRTVPLQNVVVVMDIAKRNELKLVVATQPN